MSYTSHETNREFALAFFFRLKGGKVDWRGVAHVNLGRNQNQTWNQWLVRDGKTFAIDEFDRKTKREKGEGLWKSYGRSQVQMPMLDLFDDISFGSFVDHNPPGTQHHAEMDWLIVGPGEFTSQSVVGHELTAKWKYPKFDVKVLFDVSKDSLPVEIKMNGESRKQICRIKWQEQDKKWVPTHIRHVSETRKKFHFIKADWLIGDKVPDVLFKEGVDLRIEVPKLFGFVADEWDPNYRSGTEYEPPPDLYFEPDKK